MSWASWKKIRGHWIRVAMIPNRVPIMVSPGHDIALDARRQSPGKIAPSVLEPGAGSLQPELDGRIALQEALQAMTYVASNVPDLEVEHDVVVEHAVHRPSTRRSARYCNCKLVLPRRLSQRNLVVCGCFLPS
jgi:hypothetical protein